MAIDPLLTDPPRGSGGTDAKSPTTRPYGRRRATAALAACGVAVVVGFGITIAAGDDPGDATATTGAAVTAATSPPTAAAIPTTVPSIDTPGSLWWLVNPQRPLPDGYVPPDLVTPDVPLKPDTGASQLSAATAAGFEAMVADAAAAGFQLQLNSGYRSLEQQQMLYDRFVAGLRRGGRGPTRRRARNERAPDRARSRRRSRRPARRPAVRRHRGKRLGRRQRPPLRVHPALPAREGRDHRLRQRAVAPALRRRRAGRRAARQRPDDGGVLRRLRR